MPERPCLDYYIHRCKAPCILAQSQMEYRAMIDEVVLFLDGQPDEVMRRVREQMESASQSLDFERAAELRDALRHLERWRSRQSCSRLRAAIATSRLCARRR